METAQSGVDVAVAAEHNQTRYQHVTQHVHDVIHVHLVVRLEL